MQKTKACDWLVDYQNILALAETDKITSYQGIYHITYTFFFTQQALSYILD